MQFDKEYITIVRNFLTEKGVMDEFCEAYLSKNGMSCFSNKLSIIDSFTWDIARRKQNNSIDWADLNYKLSTLIRKEGYKSLSIQKEHRKSFIAQLRESKLLKLKRYVNALRDYSE